MKEEEEVSTTSFNKQRRRNPPTNNGGRITNETFVGEFAQDTMPLSAPKRVLKERFEVKETPICGRKNKQKREKLWKERKS